MQRCYGLFYITSLICKPLVDERFKYTLQYSKTCVKHHSEKDWKLVYKTNFRLMQVKSIAEVYYFWPSFSYHLSLRSLFYLFLSGHFTQVLQICILYCMMSRPVRTRHHAIKYTYACQWFYLGFCEATFSSRFGKIYHKKWEKKY